MLFGFGPLTKMSRGNYLQKSDSAFYYFNSTNESRLIEEPSVGAINTQINTTINLGNYFIFAGLTSELLVGKTLGVDIQFYSDEIKKFHYATWQNPAAYNNADARTTPATQLSSASTIPIASSGIISYQRLNDPKFTVAASLADLENLNSGKNANAKFDFHVKVETDVTQNSSVTAEFDIPTGSTSRKIGFFFFDSSPVPANSDAGFRAVGQTSRNFMFISPPSDTTITCTCKTSRQTFGFEDANFEGMGNGVAKNLFSILQATRYSRNGVLDWNSFRDFNMVLLLPVFKSNGLLQITGNEIFEQGRYTFTLKLSGTTNFPNNVSVCFFVIEDIFAITNISSTKLC